MTVVWFIDRLVHLIIEQKRFSRRLIITQKKRKIITFCVNIKIKKRLCQYLFYKTIIKKIVFWVVVFRFGSKFNWV